MPKMEIIHFPKKSAKKMAMSVFFSAGFSGSRILFDHFFGTAL